MQNLLNMLRLTANAPTIAPLGDDEPAADGADEPPDDLVSPLPVVPQSSLDHKYPRESGRPANNRRESLLTRAIRGYSNPPEYSPTSPVSNASHAFSTTSSHGTVSTAELTSDENLTTPPQSATPSPPAPLTSLAPGVIHDKQINGHPSSKREGDLPSAPNPSEAAVEKTLGRKRCIMFACAQAKLEKEAESQPSERSEPVVPPKRKCMLTFACPSRNDKKGDLVTEILERSGSDKEERKSSIDSAMSEPAVQAGKEAPVKASETSQVLAVKSKPPKSPQQFHEFGSSVDDHDAWVDKPVDQNKKLTLQDCWRKESAFRRLGEEAEDEAEAEDEEQEDPEDPEEDVRDDFAPSDESSDGGNESDDEGGFADSDDESDEGSDGLFWAPSTTTAATSTTNVSITHISSRQKSPASSLESSLLSRQPTQDSTRGPSKRRPKPPKMRPGTPELPDSTDFVCGTLDEDRPLEAAYIACREQRKRERHIPIPQDIDPSFPTSDPEDNDENDEEEHDSASEEELELSGVDYGHKSHRGRNVANISSLQRSPKHVSPPPLGRQVKHEGQRRTSLRSPPPPKLHYRGARSPPPPRRLFGHSPTRLRSPPNVRLPSPRGSPTGRDLPVAITITKLAQRPPIGRTSSVPRTPNPFFRNYQLKRRDSSVVLSGTPTPRGEPETLKPDMHVRGPVDIVAGLETKRQKRKEKFWRQHCRKAAKEAAERKAVPGRGAERMKELGLECAERTRQYTVQQPGQLVISL